MGVKNGQWDIWSSGERFQQTEGGLPWPRDDFKVKKKHTFTIAVNAEEKSVDITKYL